ncbi:MAG: glycoside hydrolase family 3 protein, partial [Clostridia bacterium]|nr:glycoside hydrolase family 3 protein [Clostridia bacterium]
MELEKARQTARRLVSQMTAEEKMSQLLFESPAIERLGIHSYNWWNEACHGVARAGVATVFPQSIGMAASFDPALTGEVAAAIAQEGRAKYNKSVLHGDRGIYKGLTYWAPNINIFRDPRWGRGQETCGEDPFLTAAVGCAYISGLQGDD